MRRAISDFAEMASDADVAVVYFAGHGIEVDGANYVIPVDAKLSRDFDIEDEAISLDRILKSIEPTRRLRLVILDACRDNPFLKTMKRTIASRSIGRGLAKVEPAISDTLIAFAAKAGFARPILHGLATWGIAGRGLIAAFADFDATRLSAMRARLSAPVYPGETIRLEGWRDGGEIAFRARVVERDVLVLTNGRAELRGTSR